MVDFPSEWLPDIAMRMRRRKFMEIGERAQKALSSFAVEMGTLCRFSTLVAHLKWLM
jgi:hypothetical protein